ncbi:MAG: class I SAM-dependent methyltransferase [Candidatus Promineifilaceae bacterium]|nr:class I SAM-dependent methyltransferase [Candidatus Promineifilaceae bacterium]
MKRSLPVSPLAILEIGAGIGTMIERFHERQLLKAQVSYTAIDADQSNINTAVQRVRNISAQHNLELETIDLFDFIAREKSVRYWDLIIAHAFLDLVDLKTTLPLLFGLLKPGGLFYFTLNFDGGTIFQPVIDPALDAKISALYHRTMDERVISGRPAGHSQTGRRLFKQLAVAGGEIISSGSSDWVVFSRNGRYPADEMYFLHFILHTVQGALQDHPELNRSLFEAWIAQRHAQIEAGTLVYIAHQLDFFGRLKQ